MTKKEHDALGQIFAAEIYNRLPYQSKAKIYKSMEEQGLVFFEETLLPGHPPVRVPGYYLTHKGRFAYCSSEYCGEWDDEGEPKP